MPTATRARLLFVRPISWLLTGRCRGGLKPTLPAAVVCLMAGLLAGPAVAADRPPAPRLLPLETLAYLRVADMPALVVSFQETMLGRISQDEQVKPLLTHLWGSLVSAADRLEDQLDVSLPELLSIPQGEVCLALVAPVEGNPAVVLLVDAKDHMPVVDRVLERAQTAMAEQGAMLQIENLGETELIIHQLPGNRQREFAYVQRDGTLIASTSSAVARDIVAAWDGLASSSLADDPDFAAIMRRCGGEQGVPPQITFFVDPIEIVQRVGRGNFAGRTLIALLPALGLDGVRGAGGSIALASEQYDTVLHLHLLLANPRKGIPAILALGSGDLTPESFIPSDVVSYTSLRWDIPTSHAAGEELYDAIRGEGALKRLIERRVSTPLGVDFEQEVLQALTGRFTHTSWMVRPARLNSRAHLIGIELKDATAFRKTWLRIAERAGAGLQRETLGTTEYWQIRVPAPPSDGPDAPLLRQPDPAIAIVGDHLLLTDSTQLLRQAILTYGGAAARLSTELDYKLIVSRIRRHPGGENPGMMSFNRPEESLRLLYELAASEATRQRLSAGAEANPVFGALDGALRDNQLPPFSVIARYLAPGGSLLTNDETGFHYTHFTLRRN